MDWMREKPDGWYDLAIVDPPYNLARFRNGIGKNDRHKIKTTNNLWNNNAPTEEYFLELFRISKNQIVFGANNFIMPPSEYFLIWNKNMTVDNFACAEYAWVSMGLKMPAKVFNYTWNGMLQEDMKNKQQRIHPTEKPIALYKWLLENYAKHNQRILDTHGGSFSHAIAAYDLDFALDIIEIDPVYFSNAKSRYDAHVLRCTEIEQIGYAKSAISKNYPTLF